MKNKEEEAMNAYIKSQEGKEPKEATIVPVGGEEDRPKSTKEEVVAARMARQEKMGMYGDDGLKYQDNLGYMKIDVTSLPTQGLFYPEGTEIQIRAARGAEIKHWSTMNIQDQSSLEQIDDLLNYIIERCVSVKMPGVNGPSWKDLKEVDRLYLIMAVHDFTYIDGENELMVPVSEGKDMPVKKEMIDFIKIPDSIMKYYDPEIRGFHFKLKTGREINMYLPGLGANQWLTNYAKAKQAAREGFDIDFIQFAPFLIPDFRRLTQKGYEDMVLETRGWSTSEWSLISHVRDELSNAIAANIKYIDDAGVEVTIPLNFRGGIKALFTISDPLSILC